MLQMSLPSLRDSLYLWLRCFALSPLQRLLCLHLTHCLNSCFQLGLKRPRSNTSYKTLVVTYGVQLTLRKGRRTRILATRLKAAGQRFKAITRLVRLDRAARKLSRTGALPQALWGAEVLGIAPSVLSRFRSQFAASSGITQTGRCATTAIRISFAADPMDDHTLRVVKSMRRALRKALASPGANELRAAWAQAKDDVLCPAPVPPNTLAKHTSEEPRWSKVSGPISAAIAILSPLGWRLPNPQRWTSPEGAGCNVLEHPEVPFLRLVSKSVQAKLWKKAAAHYCAAGIESSPDPVSFKLLKALRKDGASTEVGLLECMLCGGFWFPERVAAAFPREVSPLCDQCPHQVPATPAHVLWECPSHKLSDHPM